MINGGLVNPMYKIPIYNKQLYMNKLLLLLHDFGFCTLADFAQSTFRINIWRYLSSVSLIFSFICGLAGLDSLVAIFFALVLVAELVTGITAAKLNGKKIRSRPLQRFALKIFVYIILLTTLNQLRLHYKNDLTSYIYKELYDFILLYIIGVYTVSIFENLERMDKKRGEFSKIISFITLKLNLKKDEKHPRKTK